MKKKRKITFENTQKRHKEVKRTFLGRNSGRLVD